MKNVSKILTANRLADGISVWFAHPQLWAQDVKNAAVATTPEAIAALEAVAIETLAKAQHCDVVLIDVELTPEGPRPLKLRERIRADGPTIQPDMGQPAA